MLFLAGQYTVCANEGWSSAVRWVQRRQGKTEKKKISSSRKNISWLACSVLGGGKIIAGLLVPFLVAGKYQCKKTFRS